MNKENIKKKLYIFFSLERNRKMDGFNGVMRKEKLGEELEKVKQWKKDGKTKEEVLAIMDKRILIEEDIEAIYTEEKQEEIIMLSEETSISSDRTEGIVYLKDEELLDYENQPFINDNEADNLELEESIKINGIIEPIVVRQYEGKYQILSGHRRRMCGKKAGVTEFPCFVYEKNDNEAKLYLVDTNLVSRKFIRPTERAKAYLMRKEALENEKDSVREILMQENNISNGNVQRYLRINYLNNDLQKAVDDKKINLKIAEQLSFLKEKEQDMIFGIIKDGKQTISEAQAKKIRKHSKEYTLTQQLVEEIFMKKDNIRKITIEFLETELEEFGLKSENKVEIKRIILDALKQKQ